MGSELARMAAVTSLSFRGTLRGWRLGGLSLLAAAPSFLVLVLASARPGDAALGSAVETLYVQLTLPIVVLLIVLVISVAQFRSEIDADTLLYLSDRSIRRPTIVLGKYLGSLGAILVLVIPATLLPLAVAVGGGAPPVAIGVSLSLVAATALAAMAYGAFFLFLGLTSRSALLIGLLYGIIWEELVPLLPGDIPRLTVIYYLRSLLSWEVPSGPLSGAPTVVPLSLVLVALFGMAVTFVALGGAVFRFLETAPERETG
ncbi:MAG: hypothetical protein L3K17_05520 [Thermoplasmata archaeon]|nr:hypothetical protein [Thermoplasmata archaeon]